MKKILGFIKKHKKAIIIVAILLVVGIGGFKIYQAINKAKNLLAGMQSSASTEEIEERDIVNSVTATGTIVAVDKRTLSSTVTGVKVKQLNVKVGDSVNAGDIICLLDGENLEQQLADAKTMLNADAGRSSLDVSSSNRGLNEAITTRDISATRGEQDKKDAYNDVQAAANECQEAKDKYDSAANTTRNAKNDLEAAQRALDEAEAGNAPNTEEIKAQMVSVSKDFDDRLSLLRNYINSIQEKYPDVPISSNPADGVIKGEYNYIVSGWDTGITDISSDISNLSVWSIYTGDNSDIRNVINDHISTLKSEQAQVATLSGSLSQNVPGDVEGANARLAQAKAAYESALVNEESQKSMYESKAKTVESLIDSYNNVLRNIEDSARSNESNVASRVDGVKSSQLSASTATLSDKRNIEQLQEQVDSCVVTSTIGGIVTDVSVVEGDNYVGGAIVTIENTSDYEISAQIDEYDIAKIKVGQEVIVKTNGTGTLEMKGEVKSIAPHASQNLSSTGVKYEVKIALLDKNPDIRLDMTAKVEIICDKSEGVLSVASEAIQEDEEGNFFVEVLDSGSTIDSSELISNPEGMSKEDVEALQSGEKTYESHNVYITKGLVGDYYTEISGDGLEVGTKIVIPNDGAFSDMEEYMSEAGAAGGF